MNVPQRDRKTAAQDSLIVGARGNLQDWLRFWDRGAAPYSPMAGTFITTDHSWDTDNGSSSRSDWIREGWSIRSELIPLDVIDTVLAVRWEDDQHIETGWVAEGEFAFGEREVLDEIELRPWCDVWRHPVSQELQVQFCRDFLLYHAARVDDNGQVLHPTDNITVARTWIDTHAFWDPAAHVEVHESYLRDFLAARGVALLIRIVSDRYANAPTEVDLGITTTGVEEIAQSTWLQTIVGTASHLGYEGVLGRGTLWRTLVVRPLDEPSTDRTPWAYFWRRFDPQAAPTFIINAEGERAALGTPNCPAYLYFRPEVLQKYLTTDDHHVRFHMRTWGRASAPRSSTGIDVGINEEGLVNAFAKDISDQHPADQAYWSSFATTPSGGICSEMFQTLTACNPPNSPGVVELVSESIAALRSTSGSAYDEALHSGSAVSEKELDRLSVGPLSRKVAELCPLAQSLFAWVVDRLQTRAIRAAIGTRVPIEDSWRQIRLLQALLEAESESEQDAKQVVAPLHGLNRLRIAAAHSGQADVTSAFELFGRTEDPSSAREAWDVCVDTVVGSLLALTRVILERNPKTSQATEAFDGNADETNSSTGKKKVSG